MDQKDKMSVIDEICEMKNCNYTAGQKNPNDFSSPQNSTFSDEFSIFFKQNEELK